MHDWQHDMAANGAACASCPVFELPAKPVAGCSPGCQASRQAHARSAHARPPRAGVGPVQPEVALGLDHRRLLARAPRGPSAPTPLRRLTSCLGVILGSLLRFPLTGYRGRPTPTAPGARAGTCRTCSSCASSASCSAPASTPRATRTASWKARARPRPRAASLCSQPRLAMNRGADQGRAALPRPAQSTLAPHLAALDMALHGNQRTLHGRPLVSHAGTPPVTRRCHVGRGLRVCCPAALPPLRSRPSLSAGLAGQARGPRPAAEVGLGRTTQGHSGSARRQARRPGMWRWRPASPRARPTTAPASPASWSEAPLRM